MREVVSQGAARLYQGLYMVTSRGCGGAKDSIYCLHRQSFVEVGIDARRPMQRCHHARYDFNHMRSGAWISEMQEPWNYADLRVIPSMSRLYASVHMYASPRCARLMSTLAIVVISTISEKTKAAGITYLRIPRPVNPPWRHSYLIGMKVY